MLELSDELLWLLVDELDKLDVEDEDCEDVEDDWLEVDDEDEDCELVDELDWLDVELELCEEVELLDSELVDEFTLLVELELIELVDELETELVELETDDVDEDETDDVEDELVDCEDVDALLELSSSTLKMQAKPPPDTGVVSVEKWNIEGARVSPPLTSTSSNWQVRASGRAISKTLAVAAST